MNKAVGHGRIAGALLVAALLLTAIAWLRSAEYDEQYTLFLTGRVARPTWPAGVITARDVHELQHPRASFLEIAYDLRSADVHPPLYFWAVAGWRRIFGDSLFAARLASVSFSVVSLGLVAKIARSVGIPPIAAVMLTAGCYGFAYTGAVARGFALAQMLSLAGIAVLLAAPRCTSRAFAAGAFLGAATFANYLAGFVACAVLIHSVIAARRVRLAATTGPIVGGFAVWLPADLWFFLDQRQSRIGQFSPFEPIAAMLRLGQYSAATLFGGLPLYVDGPVRAVVIAVLALLLMILVTVTVRRWHCIATPETRLLLAMAATAPPVGLLLLGALFDNTPIELRYLAFATPFIGLLLAAAQPVAIRYAVLAVQLVALCGLMTRPETMQPARATASAAETLVGDGVVLVPTGNDGVGIVGAFAIESSSAQRLIVVGRDASPSQIRARASRYPRVVLALLGQDAASRATLPVIRLAFADPCWRPAGEGFNVLALDRICQPE